MNQNNLPADTKLKCHDCGARAIVTLEFGVDKETGYLDAIDLCDDCFDVFIKAELLMYGIE